MKPVSSIALACLAALLSTSALADTSTNSGASLFGAFFDAIAKEIKIVDPKNDQQSPSRRMGNPAVFANTSVSRDFEKELLRKPDEPVFVAKDVCSTYGGHEECFEFLRPRVEEEIAKVVERQAQVREVAMQLQAAADEKEKKRLAEPAKAAADLERAEARMTELVKRVVKLRPESAAPLSSEEATWRIRIKGECREMVGKALPGSIEARIAITDCWTTYTNMRSTELEKAVTFLQADQLNAPLRSKPQ